MESTIELLAESQYHFIWRVDEIIKSSIEFSWDFELESDNVKTNFFYTVDLNGNKVLVVRFEPKSSFEPKPIFETKPSFEPKKPILGPKPSFEAKIHF